MDTAPGNGGTEIIPATEATARAQPQHHFTERGIQFRLVVQPFTHAPAEAKVQRISLDSNQARRIHFRTDDLDPYLEAYRMGYSSAMPRPRSTREQPAERDPEDIERACWRAKANVRKLVTELQPSHLHTFTTRFCASREDILGVFSIFIRMVLRAEPSFQYVAVPEPHPSNPDHWHLHAATRTRLGHRILRRLWHLAILRYRKLPLDSPTHGEHSPGNVDDGRRATAARGFIKDPVARARRIARYIAKYIAKGFDGNHFNRKRYWASRTITVAEARVFWLTSPDQVSAILEALRLLGGAGTAAELVRIAPFMPSDRIAWWMQDPDKWDPPPF